MTTGGNHGSAAVLVVVLVVGGLIGGCGPEGTGHGATAAPLRSASAPSATPPEDLCARIVTYWSRKAMDRNTYGDYQSMGMSDGQYGILRDVVDAARAEKKRHGARAADELIVRQAREGCVDWYRTGGPGKGPWR